MTVAGSTYAQTGRKSKARAIWALSVVTVLYIVWTALLLTSGGEDTKIGLLYLINCFVLASGTITCCIIWKITPTFVSFLSCLVQVAITITMLIFSLGDVMIVIPLGFGIAWVFYVMPLLCRERTP